MNRLVIFSRKKDIRLKVKGIKTEFVSNPESLKKKKPCIVIIDSSSFNSHSIPAACYKDKICILYGTKKSAPRIKGLYQRHKFFDYFTESTPVIERSEKIRRAFIVLKLQQEKEKLKSDLKNLTILDPDTGCFKAKYFLEIISQELDVAKKNLYPITFVIFDIDYFRQINESFPYRFAELILRGLSKIIVSHTSKETMIVRWRADAFIATLPRISKREAYAIARKVKDAVYSKRFCYRRVCKTRITLSSGIVIYPGDGVSNYQEIIVALEAALGASKKEGGNRITFYSKDVTTQLEDTDKEKDVIVLTKKVRYLNRIVNRELLDMIYAFAKTIQARDLTTARHVENTGTLAKRIAKELDLPQQEIDNIYHAAVLHDLGKVGIDRHILQKRGSLDKDERETIKTHPWIATEILREIHALRGAVPAILYHHEKWDGSGYPFGLKGDEIPVAARIIAIADVYEALISNRPYRKAYSKKRALSMIKKERGKSFDPVLVDLFIKLIRHYEEHQRT